MAPHSAGDLVCGRYEIRALVGRRPLSTVYHAFDREIGVEVALRVMHKELFPDEAARIAFVQKVTKLREVAHPNLLRMYDVVASGGEIVVAVQWAPGTQVRELLDRAKGGLPADEVRQIVAAVAAGVGHAHQRGMVLGDIRPETVMRVDDTVKVSVGVGLALPRRAYLEAMAGTRAREYLAPELRAGRIAEPRADVYSLAVMTAEMLSGELPTSGVRALSSLPVALGPLLSRALAEDPMLRPPTVEALARDIDVALGGPPPERRRRITGQPFAAFDEPPTMPETPAMMSHLIEATRQVDEAELAAIQGSAVTRKVHEDEIYRLRVESGGTDELDVEMLIEPPVPQKELELEADYEHGLDTERVFLLEPDAAKTEPRERLDPEADADEDDDALTNRVEKIDPDATPLPPPLPAGAKDLGPAKLPDLPTIEVSELPVEVLPPRPHFPPPPPRPAPRLTPAPIAAEHAAALPPPLPPPPLPPPAPVERPGVDLARRLRGASSTDEVKALPDPSRRRGRLWPVALVVIAGVSLFTAVVMAVVAHMNSVHLEQQRLAAERLAAELRAQAEQLRHDRGVIASPSPEPEAEPPPVAAQAPSEGPCPLGANLVDGKKPFCIDVYEYPGGKTIPRTDVGFDEAERLCQSRGQRLCTDHEWERACRGKGGASYPYGAGYDPARCNTRGGDGEADGEIARAGSFAQCRSASGAYDMSGNVAEWVIGTHGRAQKGGSAATGNPQARCSNTVKNAEPGLFVGFRCCSDPR